MPIANQLTYLPAVNEHEEQSKVVSWAESMSYAIPELAALYAIPNQNILLSKVKSQAHRYKVINYSKAEGLKKGVPDLHLPVSRGGYLSLYIEMKVKNNKPDKTQEEWADRLSDLGNLVIYCWSAQDAIQVLVDYLNGAYTIT